MTDVWIYVAADRFTETELIRADSVARIRLHRGERVLVDRMMSDSTVHVADPVTVIGEPKLPDHFALWLAQTLEDARLRGQQDGRDRAVTARLTGGTDWSWEMYLLEEVPVSWRPARGSN